MQERRRVELQVALVARVYRHQGRLLQGEAIRALRARSLALLASVEREAARYPDVFADLTRLRRRLEADERSVSRRLREEPSHGPRQLVDSKRLR